MAVEVPQNRNFGGEKEVDSAIRQRATTGGINIKKKEQVVVW